VAFLLIFVLTALYPGTAGFLSAVVSAAIIIIFSFVMPRVTLKGARIKEAILGFKEFLSVTETDRLKFHNAPEKNPELFEKFLPYAMVFGVEQEWAGQFKDIYRGQPSWFESSGSERVFTSLVLADFVSDFSGTANSSMITPPSASSGGSGMGGGGFSGGGFGGGGGGSW
jgi:uncharacterized membrane protein